MNHYEKNLLPTSWETSPLETIVRLNPTLDKSKLDDSMDVSFVPMPAVEAESGRIDVSQLRKLGEVKKGYTAFQEGDVLFAKITPCMENGKMAIAPMLTGGLGFGSTEFHVLRCYDGISPEYIYYFVSSRQLRMDAEHNMTGAVGQKRVPTPWLSQVEIPLPPENEQRRIVAKIEELFSELDKAVECLKTAREQLKVYRQALLKHAFEGKLTEQWRRDNADKLESADELLARIQKEREAWLKRRITDGDSEAKRFCAKTKKSGSKYPEYDLSPLAKWVNLLDICQLIVDCHNKTAPYESSGIYLIRTPCVRDGRIFLNEEARFVSQATYEYWSRRCRPEAGDIIFTREAPMGEAGIVPVGVQLCMGQRMMLFRLPECIDSRYLLLCLMEPRFRARMNLDAVGTGVKHLRVGDVEKLCLPLFPLREQEEIVSTLEGMLSVVDEQESEIEDSLAKTEALRQSILKKAFSGQLVPQDPDDEPAGVLLERIAAEKAARAGEKGTKAKGEEGGRPAGRAKAR